MRTYRKLKLGGKYVSNSRCFYRPHDPFFVINICWMEPPVGASGKTLAGRWVYVIEFGDGEIDAFPVGDENSIEETT